LISQFSQDLQMGARTHNHILEDESRHFFKGLLPRDWVYRDKHGDYGIDCEVELFDEKGNASGLVFWVQLKATSSAAEKTIRNVSLKNDKIDQYRSYELPVLIVRYSSAKKLCYFRWASSVVRPHLGGSSTTLYFSDENVWTAQSAMHILSYLKKQNRMAKGILSFPISTFIKRVPTKISAQIPYSRITFLKRIVSSYPKYFSITNVEDESSLQLLIEEEQLIFSLTDLAFSGIGFEKVFIEEGDELITHKSVLLSFSLALMNLGRIDLGAAVFFDQGLFTFAALDPVYLINFLSPLLSGPDFSRTMDLLCAHLANHAQRDNFLERKVNLIILPQRKHFDQAELHQVEQFLLLALKSNATPGDEYARAASCYNLGNFYRSVNNFPSALDYLFKARRYRKGYASHAYFLEEIAGILFQLGKFYFAERLFRKALLLPESTDLLKGYIGDCLLYQGKYEQACLLFDEFLMEKAQGKESLDEWYLKFSCLKSLMEFGYPKAQQRDAGLANDLVREKKFEEALDADMLNPMAWYQTALESYEKGGYVTAFVAFIMLGLLRKEQIAPLVHATMIGFNHDLDKSLVMSIIKIAHYYHGQAYIDEISKILKENKHPRRDMLLELIDMVLVKIPKTPVIVRFFDEGENYEVLDYGK